MARLERLEDESDPLAALLKKDGLSNLLAYAAQLPPPDPDDLPAAAEPTTSFTALLREARLRAREQEGEAC
jgi:hypothetical protein